MTRDITQHEWGLYENSRTLRRESIVNCPPESMAIDKFELDTDIININDGIIVSDSHRIV